MTEVGSRPASATAVQPANAGASSAQSSPLMTLSVTLAICLACSFLVSIATVLLRPIQAENRRLARDAQIADILGRQPELRDLIGDLTSVTLDERVVDLQSGVFVAGIDPAEFDPMAAAREPTTSVSIAAKKDLANIQRRAQHAVVTVVWRDRTPQAIILPIYGSGYAAVIRGSIALAGDGNTILGLIISEHDETPGIGSEIADPDWTQQWAGKKLRDAEGEFRFRVTSDETDPPDADPAFYVDGISGATQSCQGVGKMVRFWLGEDGFGPFLARIQDGEQR